MTRFSDADDLHIRRILEDEPEEADNSYLLAICAIARTFDIGVSTAQQLIDEYIDERAPPEAGRNVEDDR